MSLLNIHRTFRLILKNGIIFNRMAPDHKALLIESFKKEQMSTLMCGDGTNDCPALRKADVGVALSSEEAASSIISQIRAYGESAEFATHIIDAYNQVANNFSVGTNDLSKAMEVASAGMATYGNSFEQTIGLIK